MRFSICVPVYNVEKYLRECIESVLSQNYDDYELILVDDGSTDSSGSICDEYASTSNKIHVIHQDNIGLMLTRRSAIEVASGEYLLFLDSDDAFKAGILEKLDEYITNSAADVHIYRAEAWYKNKCIPMRRSDEVYGIVSKEDMARKLLSSFSYNSIWTKAVRREVIIGHLDEIYKKVNFSEDMIQTAYIIKYADSFEIIDETLYKYRMRNGSLVHSNVTEETIIESLQTLHKVEMIVGDIVQPIIEEWDYYFDSHKRNVLNNFLEHIYRYNCLKHNAASTQQVFDALKKNTEYVRLISDDIVDRLNFYNKYRFRLFASGQYSCLSCLDRILRQVQNIQRLCLGRKAFK